MMSTRGLRTYTDVNKPNIDRFNFQNAIPGPIKEPSRMGSLRKWENGIYIWNGKGVSFCFFGVISENFPHGWAGTGSVLLNHYYEATVLLVHMFIFLHADFFPYLCRLLSFSPSPQPCFTSDYPLFPCFFSSFHAYVWFSSVLRYIPHFVFPWYHFVCNVVVLVI